MTPNELRKIRLSKKMTQKQMAAFLCCDVRTYMRYEAGTLRINRLREKVVRWLRQGKVNRADFSR